MIQEDEIMCGNYFIHNDNWCSREHKDIFQWDSQHFYEIHQCTLFLENVSPIPLTEDILIRCGFEKDGLGIFYKRNKGYSCFYYPNTKKVTLMTDKGNQCTTDAKKLHTLQNLVKLLCNQTIELKCDNQ